MMGKKIFEFFMGPPERVLFPIPVFLLGFVAVLVACCFSMSAGMIASFWAGGAFALAIITNVIRQKKWDDKVKKQNKK